MKQSKHTGEGLPAILEALAELGKTGRYCVPRKDSVMHCEHRRGAYRALEERMLAYVEIHRAGPDYVEEVVKLASEGKRVYASILDTLADLLKR